jgi:hypothetical protein
MIRILLNNKSKSEDNVTAEPTKYGDKNYGKKFTLK